MKKNAKKPQNKQPKKQVAENKYPGVYNGRRINILLALLVVFFIPVLLYLQTLTFKYTGFDDTLIIEEHLPFLSDMRNAPQAFLKNAFVEEKGHFYRPLQTLSYMADIQLSGKDSTWGYHLSNVLLLGLIACSLFLLLHRLLIPFNLSLLSTLIFCVHPLFVSNVAWIPSRGDLQLMFFTLLSFLFLLEFLSRKKYIHLLLHWLAFTFSLFCKETAVFLPVLYILFYFVFFRKKDPDIIRKKARLFLVFLLYIISLAAWYWIRSKALGETSNQDEVSGAFGQNDEVGLIPILQNLRTIPEALMNFFIPVNIQIIPGFSVLKTTGGIIIMAILSVLFFRSKERPKREKFFCLTWFVLLLIPTMLYKNVTIDYLHHRFLLPMTGILLFVLFVLPMKQVIKNSKKITWVLIALITALSAFSFIKARPFADPMTYFTSAIHQNPKSVLAYYNRGNLYEHMKELDKAISDYSQAITLKPDYFSAYNNRGNLYCDKGLYDYAINDFNKAIALKHDFIEAYSNRGIAYYDKGLYDNAITDYSKAIELKPDFALAYNNRGNAYGAKASFNNSIEDFTKAIQYKPDYAEAYNNRGNAHGNLGFTDNAFKDFYKAIELNPDYADAHNNLGVVYERQGQFDKAIQEYSKAIEINPDFANAYNNRGVSYYRNGIFDKSCEDFRKAEQLGNINAKDNVLKFCK